MFSFILSINKTYRFINIVPKIVSESVYWEYFVSKMVRESLLDQTDESRRVAMSNLVIQDIDKYVQRTGRYCFRR